MTDAPACTHYSDAEGVCGSTEGVTRYLPGLRCTRHGFPQPRPNKTRPARSPVVPPRQYGTARTDPLGRDGPGWKISAQSKLPTRSKDEK